MSYIPDAIFPKHVIKNPDNSNFTCSSSAGDASGTTMS